MQESQLSASLEQRWRGLTDKYLPVRAASDVWVYSREPGPDDADQGWKLHISATIGSACQLLERVGPLLSKEGILFKGPRSLAELARLNSGLYFGYSQVGKWLPVYPNNRLQAVEVAHQLDAVTSGLPAPTVPYDFPLRPRSCIYYRYGAFVRRDFEKEDGSTVLGLLTPDGRVVPDERDRASIPDWEIDPFQTIHTTVPVAEVQQGNPFNTYEVFHVLSQRGKGGVYLAIDSGSTPNRVCVIKEGRLNGEPEWDGRDGAWRVKRELDNLLTLNSLGSVVPSIYSFFELEGNSYLVTEFIEGPNLQTMLSRRKRRLSFSLFVNYGIQLANLLDPLHKAGWVWRDCKPSNLVVCKSGKLRPLDFESAQPTKQANPLSWVTAAFAAPETRELNYVPSVSEDLYAMGVVFYYLLTGNYPEQPNYAPIEKLRRNVPPPIINVVNALLSANPSERPTAASVANTLSMVTASG